MFKRSSLLCMVIFISLILTSCYDSTEITDVAYVEFIGIDKGLRSKWRITITIASQIAEQGSGSGGSDQSSESKSVTIEAPSFYSAVNLLNTNIPRNLEFSHANLLVVSEEVARSGLIGEYIAPLIRFREIRRTIDIVAVQGSAQEFIEKIEPFLGGSIVNTIEDLMQQAKYTGYFPRTTLNDFYNAIKSTYIQPVVTLGGLYNPDNWQKINGKESNKFNIPAGDFFAGEVPRKGGNPIEFFGSALFDGDRMIGKLNGYETKMMMLARGDLKTAIFTIQDPKSPELIVPIELKLARKPKVNIRFEGNVPVITLKLKTNGDILAIQSRINYEDPELTPILEKAMKQHLKANLDKVIEKCKSMSCDAFYFGRTAVRQFLTIDEWEAYHWNKQFSNAKVITEIDFKVRSTEGMLKSAEIITSEGAE